MKNGYNYDKLYRILKTKLTKINKKREKTNKNLQKKKS